MRSLVRLTLILFMLVFFGCDENPRYDSRTVTTRFWTSTGPDEKFYLYIDGRKKGVVPYSLTVPDADESSDRMHTLAVKMHSGKYRIEIKNEDGRTVYREKFNLSLRRRGTSISTHSNDDRGGSKLIRKGNTLIKELYFD